MSINNLRIDEVIYEVLTSNKITKVSELTSKTPEEVKMIFGYDENSDNRTMYLRLRRAVRELGLNFKDEYVALGRKGIIIELKIERLNIPLETKKVLKLNGIYNVGDLLSIDYKDLRCFSKMTSMHLNAILKCFYALGFILRDDVTSCDMNPIRLMVSQAETTNEQQKLLEREQVKRIRFVRK